MFERLLSPLRVGRAELRNRVVVTAHVPGMEAGGLVNDDYVAYQRARAAGGAALQISGASAVHATGGVGGGRGLMAHLDGAEERYRQLADAVHAEGGRFLLQLGHAAACVADSAPGRPMLAPSPVMSDLVREMPKAMRLGEIDEMVEAYGRAAAKARAGGLDGCEILAAFGYLPAAFMSPLTNLRGDDYGGSLENRLRFVRRVIAKVRAALGPEPILGLRLPGDERVEGGLDAEAMGEIAAALEADGGLDYLNVIAGTNYERLGRMEHWGPSPQPHGIWVSLAAAIRRRVSLPVLTVGRITDPAMAEEILARGDADLVGMTRAQISDPELVAKLRAGRPEDVRPCVGANVCIARAMVGKPIRCFHNASVGRETLGAPALAARPRHVAVIGGGVAGMEAARVAAERGHRVTLHEAGEALGGQLRRWAAAPMTREFGKTLEWYAHRLGRLQVEVRLGARVVTLDGLDADAVVIATGARPVPPEVPGDGTVRLLDAWEAISAPPRGHVVVRDAGGGRAGLSAADAVLESGRVTIVTTETAAAEMVTPTVRAEIYKRFLAAGCSFRPNEAVVRVERAGVVVRNIYTGEEGRIDDVDALVDWRGCLPEAALGDAAAAAGIPHVTVGDCVAPREMHVAIAEAAAAAREL